MDLLPLNNGRVLQADNAAIADFLSSTAAVLYKKGYLSLKDRDALRMTLSATQSGDKISPEPLLQALVAQDLEYLQLLSTRYGVNRLGSNILRFTLKPEIQKLALLLNQWGESLIPLAKQGFNRPFYLYEGGVCEGKALYAAIIMQLSEEVAHSCQRLSSAVRHCSAYFPHALAASADADSALDAALAEALGFDSLCSAPFPALSDRAWAQLVIAAIEPLVATVRELSSHMSQQGKLVQAGPLEILAEWLSLEVAKFAQVRFASRGHLLVWEAHRTLCLQSLHNLRHYVSQLAQNFNHLLREHQKLLPQAAAPFKLSRDVARSIAAQLIAGGLAAKTADQATQALLSYLQKNALQPQDLLIAELNKIDHSLTPEALQLLQDFSAGEQLVKVALKEKQRALQKAEDLGAVFKTQIAELSKVLTAVLLLLTLLGCGLKMAPKSELLDYRPSVPRAEADEAVFERAKK